MSFEHYLEKARTESQFSVNKSWGQGRTLFGGVSAAIALEQTRQQVDASRPLRSLAVSFCGATLADTDFNVSTQLLSDGKSVSQINGYIVQNEKVVTQVTACYGVERKSEIDVQAPAVEIPKLGSGQRMSYISGLTPEFVQHIDYEYTRGQFPFSNSKHNELAGWMRFNEPGTEFTEAHLVGLIDSWPPVVLQKLKKLAPAATVTWNLEIVQPISMLETKIQADDWLYYEAEVKQAHHGYAHTEARVYAADGILIALSRQLVTVYG